MGQLRCRQCLGIGSVSPFLCFSFSLSLEIKIYQISIFTIRSNRNRCLQYPVFVVFQIVYYYYYYYYLFFYFLLLFVFIAMLIFIRHVEPHLCGEFLIRNLLRKSVSDITLCVVYMYAYRRLYGRMLYVSEYTRVYIRFYERMLYV